MPEDIPKKMTMLILSDDPNKVTTAFLVVREAVAKGMKVNLFFMSSGMKSLKKGAKLRLKGILMPFTSIVMKRREASGIERLSIQIEKIRKLGVKFYGCETCTRFVGIRKDDMIPGVELVERGRYIDLALESDVNLVID